jgi:hypothetical protein
MIAPTAAYERVPALRPNEAADLICEGIVTRAFAVTAREGLALQLARSIAPGTLEAGISLVTRRLGGGAPPTASDGAATGERAIPAAR